MRNSNSFYTEKESSVKLDMSASLSGVEKIRTELPPVILLGGQAIALSLARTLGRRGITVYALDVPASYIRHSRYVQWIPLDYNGELQSVWLNWLIREGPKLLRGAVVLPGSDDALELIACHRAELANDYVLIEANDDVLLAMLDKAKTFDLAKSVGIPSPQIWRVNSREDLLRVATKVTYPCALKPRHSHFFAKCFPHLKLFVIQNENEMLRTFDQIRQMGLEMIVTDIIPGADDQYYSYYTYLDEAGKPLFHFTKRKLRQYPNGFGQWTYHVTGWYPDVAELGLRFFQGIKLRGIGTIEFKYDARDNQLKLIECNPRFTLAIEMLKISGVDLASIVYNRLVGLPVPTISDFRRGIYVIRPLSDFLAFRECHRRGEMSWGKYIASLMHRQHYQYFRWTDPMPMLVRFFPFIVREIRKFAAKLKVAGDKRMLHKIVRSGYAK